jgi:hypothetical protein
MELLSSLRSKGQLLVAYYLVLTSDILCALYPLHMGMKHTGPKTQINPWG